MIVSDVRSGGRYYSIYALVCYGRKCSIPTDEIEKDAWTFYDLLESRTDDELNHFSKNDMSAALKQLKEPLAYKCTREFIADKCKVFIPENKRNYQRQAEHLEEARAIRDIRMKRQKRKWTDGNGRPKGAGTAEQKVAAYRAEHPEANVTEVARALGISRPTVYKWWDAVPKAKEPEVHYHTLDGVKRGTFRAGYGGQWESRHIDGLAKDARRHARELASKTRKKDASEESDNS